MAPDDPRRHLAWLEVSGPRHLPPGGTGTGAVDLRVPALGGPPAGSYGLRAYVIDEASRSRAEASCVLWIERTAALRLPIAPSLTINPDGSITATITVANHGNISLSCALEIRHERGWRFVVDQPQFALNAGAGNTSMTVRLSPPEGQYVTSGDELTFELAADGGRIRTAVSTRVTPPRAASPRRPRVPGRLAAWVLAALSSITIGATFTLGSRASGAPPPIGSSLPHRLRPQSPRRHRSSSHRTRSHDPHR